MILSVYYQMKILSELKGLNLFKLNIHGVQDKAEQKQWFVEHNN